MIGMEPPPKGINHSATGSSTGPSTGSSSRPSAGRFSKSSTAFSARSFISRTVFSLCRRRPESKGPLGLTTLYSPTPEDILVADVVFIHGLNGGSHSTWSRGNDPERFWPCRWLPQDGAFKDVRIHTFGYPTDASRESPIRIPDIARSLLAAIKDSPVMNNKGNQPPLIFVAHSMGALVVKKAYILGHRDPEFKLVVDRVCAIFFLATPHQGAAIAQTLSRLTAIIRVRLYVEDLFPHSPLIQEISEEFPQVCGNIQLFSFFESRFMTIGGIKKLVVEKSSAVLNLANERGTFLDADHRNVAMYSSPDDPSYVAVKNALATVISSHQESSQHQMQCAAQEDQDALDRFLGVSDGPEDDIMIQEAVKLPGSCEWLTSKADYQSWKESVHSSFLWIRGRPGAGKSVLSGHIIGDLRSQKLDCCCFFFQARDNIKSTANGCLRSMVWQMAMHHPAVRDRLKVLMSQGRHNPIDKNDSHSVWRKLFLSGILKVKLNRPQFWVIDAMDECKAAGDMLTFLQHIQEHWPLSVLVTSRDTMDTHQKGAAPEIDIRSYTISEQDNLQDISLLLKANLPCLPCPGSDRWPTPEKIASHILEKSEGCFLWASIVCSELRQVTSEGELIKVMESTPSDMDALYRDILAKMQTARFGKAAAKALIAWATYSFRPLNVAEIQTPIEKDINDKIDVQRTISKSCGSLVYVDQYGKVQLVHATAREFLTREETESEFILSKAEGHRRLALVCLKFLLHDCPRSPGRARRLGSGPDTSRLWPSPSPLQPPQSEDPFTDYASKFAFQHLSQVHPNDEEILVMLSDFLASNNLLQWIEFTASNGDLRTILHAGKTINSILNRRAQDSPHLGRARRQGKLALLEKWGDDLIHLVTNFSGWLKRSPKAIHHLIPAFCPPDSAIHERFTNPVRGLKVQGLSSRGWNDCLTTITYPEGSRLTAVAAGPDYFAVGMMSTAGPILVYNDTIFQQVHDLRHGEPVRRLVFAGNGRLLASGGARTVRIWSLADGFQLCSFKISSRCLDLWFVEEDAVLRVATTQNHLIEWDVESNTPTHQESVKWDADFPDRMRGREPTLAKLGLTTHLLAVLYKGEDIVFWDCIDNRIHDMYEKDTGSVRVFGRHKVAGPSIPVRAAAFGQSLHTNLFAATYLDGDLVVYDIEVGNAIASAERANTLVLAASQDGRTLAGADSLGNLTLFEFETLRPLYRVRFDTPSIPAALCFTSDSLRFIEIRWGQCRVWEPSVLLRTDVQDDDINDTASVSAGPQEIDHQTIAKTVPSICAMVCSHESSLVICGMEDGSVFAYDISGPEPERQLLFVQTAQCGTHSLYLDDRASILACGDRSGRFTARTVSRPNRSRQPKTWEAGPLLIEGRIGSRDFVVLRQVLVSSKHERLLVSTVTQSTLWPMPTQGDAVCICQTEFENNRTEGSHWVTRLGPKSDLLLLVDAPNRQFKVYDWETLALIRMISPSLSPDTVLHRAAPLLHRHYFTTYARTLPKPGFAKGTEPISAPRSEILLWDYQKLEGGSEITAPRNELAALPSVVEHVIGAFGSRLVLYTTDHWIASVELSAPGSPDPPDGGVIVGSFVRHFFLPNDWVGSMVVSNMIFGVGREGEVLLARRSELAVIKRGLEVTEDGGTVHLRRPMNNNLRPLSGGRIPYRHRASSSIS